MLRNSWLALLGAVALQGCGGGGGDIASTPPPPPAPPAPAANTSFANLTSNQTFSTDSATTNVSFNLASRTTISGASSAQALTISYDATARSYTVSAPNRSQVFGPNDVITPSVTGETRYQKANGGGNDFLTRVSIPYFSNTANQYVQLAFWQRNNVNGGQQDTIFDTFVFGFPTASAAVPRTGTARFSTDVFGLASIPGNEPRVFQGAGEFNVDLQAGIYSTTTMLTETGLVTGAAIVGGGLELISSGRVSSSDGSFSGDMVYGGQSLRITGRLAGRLYGPTGQELGASFSASNSDGSSVTGSLTGQKLTGTATVNLTLANLAVPQLFYPQERLLTVTSFDGTPGFQVRTTSLITQLNDRTSGNFSYGPGISNLAGGEFTSTSIVPGPANFTTYEKTFGDQAVRLELYKPGLGNTELALTYASFGRWSSSMKNGVVTEASRVFFTYGLETPAGLLSARTGSASYQGIVAGAGANETTSAKYDVAGTSSFDVNFSSQAITGTLAMRGTSTNGAGNVDFGTYDFAGKLFSSGQSVAAIAKGGTPAGELATFFFGPTGEELGGPFNLITPAGSAGGGTTIIGVALAKRQ